MDEEKAAAYYEELTRKGGGAAKFKQGLGFSSTLNHNDSNHDDGPPKLGSALVSSSSFLSTFVKASGTTSAVNTMNTSQLDKQSQLQSIQNKLKKKPNSPPPSRVSERSHRERRRSPSLDRDRASRRRSRSRVRDRNGDRHSRKQSSSRERHRGRDRYRSRERGRRKRSRSRSRGDSDRDRRQRDMRKNGSRSKSSSPRNHRKFESSARDSGVVSKGGKSGKAQNAVIDYEYLIEGYDKMTQAERVKAKMKLQLSETAEKDRDTGPGWERFQFNTDAPVEDEEIEAAEDDATVVKHIGQSFRFSTVEAKRENQIKAAHDEAMFGVPELPIGTDSEPEKEDKQGDSNKEFDKKNVAASLLSESVLAMQKVSWRDRVRNA